MSMFDKFAGQEIASGIRPQGPLVAFEEHVDKTKWQNLEQIYGLMPKIADVIVHETRIQESELDRYFRKYDMPYGGGIEQIGFIDGPANKKQDGRCVPYGSMEAAGQIDVVNLDISIDVSIYDYEVNKYMMNAQQVGSFTAQKMRGLYKTYQGLKRSGEIQLVSDVIDGTRSISSTDASDGTGSAITYSPTIEGYAGQIEDSGIVLPALVQGTMPAFASADDALELAKLAQDHAAQMAQEGKAYSKLGISTFTLDKPLLIMETRTLNAMDNAWALDGANKQIPTKTAREYMREFAEVVEIPAFAELPTNASYTNKRLAAVLIDRDSLSEHIGWMNIEPQRCAKPRMTGYNLGGSSLLAVYRGNPACGILTDVARWKRSSGRSVFRRRPWKTSCRPWTRTRTDLSRSEK